MIVTVFIYLQLNNCYCTKMYLNIQLEKAKREIKEGLKQKAAGRLKNVLNTYPDAMEAREMLAEMYYNSGFIDMAGRYWYLTPPIEERIQKSIEVYEKSVNYSSFQILKDLKYKGHKTALPEYARKKLLTLENDIKGMGHGLPYKPITSNNPIYDIYQKTFMDKLVPILFISIITLCLLFFIVGVITAISWLVNLF